MHEEGLSLIELMVVVFVLGIALVVGVPAFTTMLANTRMTTAVNDMVTSLHAARSEAIKRRATVLLCPARAAGGTCDLAATPGSGWIVFVDLNGNGSVDAGGGEVILQNHGPLEPAIAARLSVAPADPPHYVAFDGSGFEETLPALGAPISAIEFCDERGDIDTGSGIAAGRLLTIDRTGRPQIYRTRSQVQAGPLAGC
jgi:type IV fimbrial biogenesis protein FimT